MSEELAAAKAAQAIVRRLTAKGGIETARPDELQGEIVAALERYESTLEAVTAGVLRDATSLAHAQAELERRSREADVPLGDLALETMVDDLSALLLESDHVEELFVDDDELDKIVHAALMDYLPAIAAREKAKLAAAFVKPRASFADAASLSTPTATTAHAFPLFEAPLESANVDDAGPCSYCGAATDVRFSMACFECFRAGKVASFVMDTELGMVGAKEAAAGLTHGLPTSSAPKGYTLVETAEPDADEEGSEPWVRVRIDEDALGELVRTPKYETWQGESWLFCCQKPMVFVGRGTEPLLEKLRGREETQEEVVGRLLQVAAREAHTRTQQVLNDRIAMYVFRCPQCRKHRAHWDSA